MIAVLALTALALLGLAILTLLAILGRRALDDLAERWRR